MYRDATGQPRVTQLLNSTLQGGFTCGFIPNSGMVILVQGRSPETAPAASSSENNSAAGGEVPLNRCTVMTTHMVRLRAQPNADSEIITVLPYNVHYTATARNGNWIKIIYSNTQGYVSMDYLTLSGDCGP